MLETILFRQRQPITTFLQLFFPSLLVLVLILLKLAIPPDEFETCQFRARHNPSSGPLMMLQSFVCNIQNNCGKMKDFEDYPSYPGSKLDVIVKYIEPILYNDTVQEFSSRLPGTLGLVNSTTSALNDSIIMKKFVKNDTLVKNIFYDPLMILNLLKNSTFDNATAEIFMEALIKMGMISGDLASFDVPYDLVQCSSFSISMFLPHATASIVENLRKHICKSKNETLSFLKMMQENLNYSYIEKLMEKKMSQNLVSSDVMNSLTSGILLMKDIRSLFLPTRKKREIELLPQMSNVPEVLTQMIEDISAYYNEQKFQCIFDNNTWERGNILEKLNECNLTEFISPVYELLKSKFPIWKNVVSVLKTGAKTESYETLKNCEIDVNRLVFLSKLAKNATTDILRCKQKQKRQTGNILALLNDVNFTQILETIEEWRQDEFLSMNWFDEAQQHIKNMMVQISNIIPSLESIPVSIMQKYLSDPDVLQVLIASRGSLLLATLSAALNETGYFLQNTDLWDNYTMIMQQLGERFITLTHNTISNII